MSQYKKQKETSGVGVIGFICSNFHQSRDTGGPNESMAIGVPIDLKQIRRWLSHLMPCVV